MNDLYFQLVTDHQKDGQASLKYAHPAARDPEEKRLADTLPFRQKEHGTAH